jgi:hypothetical protein
MGELPDFANVFDGLRSMQAAIHTDATKLLRAVPVSPVVENALGERASRICDRLIVEIRRFNEGLDQEHEVGVCLANFGRDCTIHLRELLCADPSLIYLRGETESGDAVQLMQHVSQVNLLLVAVRRSKPNEPKRQIGFGMAAGGEQEST